MRKVFVFLSIFVILVSVVLPVSALPAVDVDSYIGLGPSAFGFTPGVPWCAFFARLVSQSEFSIPLSDLPSSGSCSSCVQFFRLRSLFYDSFYSPVIGDWVFYDWEGDLIVDHVGVVVDVSDSSLSVLEGNVYDQVYLRSIDFSDSRIYGFAHPQIGSAVSSASFQDRRSSGSSSSPRTVVSPVSPSKADGFKAVILGLIGSYDMIVTEYSYQSGSGYTSYLREIDLDYPWLVSAGIFALFVYCIFRLLGVFGKRG